MDNQFKRPNKLTGKPYEPGFEDASGRVFLRYINKYGNEVFLQVREQVLQSIVPGSQTQGQIQGMANGGMQDDVTGMIGSTQPVAVSQDEYIIPADAMSMLGDGSSDAGAKKLDAMLKRENRIMLANACFEFISHRTDLDLYGWQDIDIFFASLEDHVWYRALSLIHISEPTRPY